MAYIPVSQRENRICRCGKSLRKGQSKFCGKPCQDRAYRERNYAKVREREDFRKQRRKHATRGTTATLTKAQWLAILRKFDNACAYCGATGKLHRDHFMPFALGYGFNDKNVVPACPSCNWSKGKKH